MQFSPHDASERLGLFKTILRSEFHTRTGKTNLMMVALLIAGGVYLVREYGQNLQAIGDGRLLAASLGGIIVVIFFIVAITGFASLLLCYFESRHLPNLPDPSGPKEDAPSQTQ